MGTGERLFLLVSVVKSGVIELSPTISINSKAPRAHEARERGAPYLRKFGDPSIREILVIT